MTRFVVLAFMSKLFLLLFTIVLTNCKEQKSIFPAFDFYPPIPDSADLKNRFIKGRVAIAQRYNLPTLTAGTNDSLVVRFWPWFAFEPYENMFEFRLDNNGWKGFHYHAIDETGDSKLKQNFGDSVFMVKSIIPKCGWDKFYDSLDFFELRSLPTESLIKDFKEKRMLDGYAYSFEIATNNSYRWIHYANPNAYPYKECMQILKIVGLFRRQFGNDYFWPEKFGNMVGMDAGQ